MKPVQCVFKENGFNDRLKNDPDFSQYFDIQPIHSQNVDKLLAGRISGMLGDLDALRLLIATHPEYRENLMVQTAPFFPSSPVYIGAGRKVPEETRDRLRQAYHIIESRNLVQEIYRKWFLEPDEVKPVDFE